MHNDRLLYPDELDKGKIQKIEAELLQLDNDLVEADGVQLKPSQCYHFGKDPLHVLFNTNCPDELKQKVEDIIARNLRGL